MKRRIRRTDFVTLREYLVGSGFQLETRPNQEFLARHGSTVVSLYSTGVVMVVGGDAKSRQDIEWFLDELAGPPELVSIEDGEKLRVTGRRIGMDEVGKGDFFGPLVTCAVLVDDSQAKVLAEAGVRDSKKLSEPAIRRLAGKIAQEIANRQWATVIVPPIRYNLLHAEMGNVNRILGWAHATALEKVLTYNPRVGVAVADQFGDERYILSRLKEKGRQIDLRQVPRAEREISVAAASILARDELLNQFARLRAEYQRRFPMGSTHVADFGRDLVTSFGQGVLPATAKIHFSTTKTIVGDPEHLLRAVEELRRTEEAAQQAAGALGRTHYQELFSLVSSLEVDLRSFIEGQLKQAYGANWWLKGIPQDVRQRAKARFRKEGPAGRARNPMECLDFGDYALVLTTKENWESAFQNRFGTMETLRNRMDILREIRNPVMHARHLQKGDKLLGIGAIAWIRERIGPVPRTR